MYEKQERLPARVLEIDEAGRGAAWRHMRAGRFGALELRRIADQNPFQGTRRARTKAAA